MIDEIIDRPDQKVPRRELGGSLCYSALTLKSLGHDFIAITCVGKDFPTDYQRFLSRKAKLDIAKYRVNEYPTTRYLIDRSSEKRKLWLKSKCRDLNLQDFKRALDESHSGSRTLVLNPVAGEISLRLLRQVSRMFERVVLDSQGFIRRFRRKTGEVSMKFGLDISALEGVHTLKADASELSAWTGTENKKDAVDQLVRLVENIIVTSGPGMVELYSKGKLSDKMMPLDVVVKDTTGAGDIQLAALAAGLAEENSEKRALRFATVASSLSVQKVGIRKAILSRAEITRRLHDVRYA